MRVEAIAFMSYVVPCTCVRFLLNLEETPRSAADSRQRPPAVMVLPELHLQVLTGNFRISQRI